MCGGVSQVHQTFSPARSCAADMAPIPPLPRCPSALGGRLCSGRSRTTQSSTGQMRTGLLGRPLVSYTHLICLSSWHPVRIADVLRCLVMQCPMSLLYLFISTASGSSWVRATSWSCRFPCLSCDANRLAGSSWARVTSWSCRVPFSATGSTASPRPRPPRG